jgi:hypothetical protein
VALDLLRARRVAIALSVLLGAVEFDDQLSLETEEIDGVVEQRNLPAELESIEAAVAQQRPEDVLGLGSLPPEPSRGLALFGRHAP